MGASMFGPASIAAGSVTMIDSTRPTRPRETRPISVVRRATRKVDAAAKAYIQTGREAEPPHALQVPRALPWYTVPSVYRRDRHAEAFPRHATSHSDSVWKVYDGYGLRIRRTCGRHTCRSFINPLTALSAELEGRHYGGGVLELIPSESSVCRSPPCKGED